VRMERSPGPDRPRFALLDGDLVRPRPLGTAVRDAVVAFLASNRVAGVPVIVCLEARPACTASVSRIGQALAVRGRRRNYIR